MKKSFESFKNYIVNYLEFRNADFQTIVAELVKNPDNKRLEKKARSLFNNNEQMQDEMFLASPNIQNAQKIMNLGYDGSPLLFQRMIWIAHKGSEEENKKTLTMFSFYIQEKGWNKINLHPNQYEIMDAIKDYLVPNGSSNIHSSFLKMVPTLLELKIYEVGQIQQTILNGGGKYIGDLNQRINAYFSAQEKQEILSQTSCNNKIKNTKTL